MQQAQRTNTVGFLLDELLRLLAAYIQPASQSAACLHDVWLPLAPPALLACLPRSMAVVERDDRGQILAVVAGAVRVCRVHALHTVYGT